MATVSTIATEGRANLGAGFYINDSKGDFNWHQTGSYTSQDPPPGWPLPPIVLDALIAANAFGPGMGLPSLTTPQNLGKEREPSGKRNRSILSCAARSNWRRFDDTFGRMQLE